MKIKKAVLYLGKDFIVLDTKEGSKSFKLRNELSEDEFKYFYGFVKNNKPLEILFKEENGRLVVTLIKPESLSMNDLAKLF